MTLSVEHARPRLASRGLARRTAATALLMAASLVTACGGSDPASPASGAATPPPAAAPAANGLTAEQLEKGIGPVTSVTLGPIDKTLAARGQELFTVKCAACHKPEARYVGPALEEVLARRTPEFVMNMMLNPAEMVAKHPAEQELLAKVFIPMADQQLTQDDARALLEYLRTVQVPRGTSAAGPDGMTQVPAK
jgi:mono/diheme cytochrome c family protein